MWLLLLAHWRGIAVGLLVAALIFGVWSYGNGRYHAGQADGKVVAVEEDAQQYKQAIQQRDQLLAQANSQLADAQQATQRAAAVSAALVSQLSTIQQQADRARQQVAAIPDSSLQADVRQRIGQLPVSDMQPFTAGELRVVDNCLISQPLLQKQVDILTDTVKAKDQEIQADAAATDAVSKQRDAWSGYAGIVEANYIRAYDAIPHKHRSARCLWLWRCQDRKLAFPSPNELHLQIPGRSK